MKIRSPLDHTTTEYNRHSRWDKVSFNRAINDLSIEDYMAWVRAGRPGMDEYCASVVRAFVLNRRSTHA